MSSIEFGKPNCTQPDLRGAHPPKADSGNGGRIKLPKFLFYYNIDFLNV